MRKAYLVAFINTETLAVVGAGIYSEPHPTTMRKLFTVPLWNHESEDFGEAHDYIAAALADGTAFEFQWVKPLMVRR